MNKKDRPRQPAKRAQKKNLPNEGILDRLFAWLDSSLVTQAAGELARECHIDLLKVICETARDMPCDETRAYVRDMAPEFLVREVDGVLQRRRARPSLKLRILAEAADQVVDLVMKDLPRVRSRRPTSRAA